MTVKEKILAILVAVGSVVSAVFYVLFRQAHDEKKVVEKELEEEKQEAEKIQTVAEIKGSGRENDEKAEEMVSDFVSGKRDASDIMHELKDRSQSRSR